MFVHLLSSVVRRVNELLWWGEKSDVDEVIYVPVTLSLTELKLDVETWLRDTLLNVVYRHGL